MVKIKENGQGLVEFAITFPLLIFVLIAIMELALMGWNYAASRIIIGQAVDEATSFVADGYGTCHQTTMARAFGAFSGPYMFNLVNWDLEVTPCPDDSSWSPQTDEVITATLSWTQNGLFYFDKLSFTSTINDESY